MIFMLAAIVFVGGFDTVSAQDTMTKKSMEKKMDKMAMKKEIKFPSIQKSPTDISYMRDGRRGPVHAKVVYSRPYKKDRAIFGELVPFGKVWRTGADEATEITFYKDVMFGGNEVKAGSYAVYTVPNKDSWEVILNTGLHQWGAFGLDAKKEVARTTAKTKSMSKSLENFSIVFSDGNMIMAWDTTMVAVPISVK